jgi:hypothetical protein
MYRHYFPLMALGQYRARLGEAERGLAGASPQTIGEGA